MFEEGYNLELRWSNIDWIILPFLKKGVVIGIRQTHIKEKQHSPSFCRGGFKK
jgi:hypothetical protein